MNCIVLLTIAAIIYYSINHLTGDGRNSRVGRSRRSFRRLIDRFGGEYRSVGFRRQPSLKFQYGKTKVEVQRRTRNGRVWTEVTADWSDSVLEMELVTRHSSFAPLLRPGLATIQVDDAVFQKSYSVRGSNVVAIEKLLSEAVRLQVGRLTRLLDFPVIRVAILRGKLSVEKPMPISRSDDLQQFTQLSIELYDQLMLTQVEGIDFLDEDEAQLVEQSICQVCGEPIVDDMVFCRRCRTPHHRDCWQYIGACSTFGCQETGYDLPMVATEVKEILPTSEEVSEDDQSDDQSED